MRGIFFLAADQSEQCYTSRWYAWVGLSAVFVLLYCLGIPIAAWLASRRQLRPAHAGWWKPRVRLLLASYTDELWWFESLDLVRKFVLASLITKIDPGSRVQLWFGGFFSCVSALLYLRLAPYRKPMAMQLQMCCLLQVLATYLAANIFHVTHDQYGWALAWTAQEAQDARYRDFFGREQTIDVLLVVVNSACFLLLGIGLSRSVRAATTARRLRHVSSGAELVSPPLGTGDQFHLFLSQCVIGIPTRSVWPFRLGLTSHAGESRLRSVWGTGQDQMRLLKTRLLELLPRLRIFLE